MIKKHLLKKKTLKKYAQGGADINSDLNGQDEQKAMNAISKTTSTTDQVRDTASNTAMMLGPIGMVVGTAMKIGGALGKAVSNEDEYGVASSEGADIAGEIIDPIVGVSRLFSGDSYAKRKAQREKLKAQATARVVGRMENTGENNYQNAVNNGIQGNQNVQFMRDGGVINLSRDSVEFEGKAHEQGGIKEPVVKGLKLNGSEVEGGETAIKQPNNSLFIFSEELGFADKHKKIAKNIGKVEHILETNQNNRFANNSLKRLQEKENNLKIEQETMKQKLGIPSELDKNKYGGLLNKVKEKSSLRDPYGAPIIRNDTSKAFLKYGGLKKYLGGGQIEANALQSAPDIANSITGLISNQQNRSLIDRRQQLLNNLPDQATNSLINPELIKANYNPALRENSLYQKGLNQSYSNPQIAAANKAAAQGQLIDSINQNQTQLNNANTQIKNEALLTNTNIQKSNNEIVMNNALRKLRGQDDIIRDYSDANANNSKNISQSLGNISQRISNNKQQKFDFSLSDPTVQRQVANTAPEVLSPLFNKQQINNFKQIPSNILPMKKANTLKDLNIMDQKDMLNQSRFGGVVKKLKKYGGGGDVTTTNINKKKDTNMYNKGMNYSSDSLTKSLTNKTGISEEDIKENRLMTYSSLQTPSQFKNFRNIEKETAPDKYMEQLHTDWGTSEGHIDSMGRISKKGKEAGFDMNPSKSKVKAPSNYTFRDLTR